MNERTWNAALAVGVASLDGAHEAQAALVDAIEGAALRGGDAREVQDLLLRLVEETSDHFAAEHALMLAARFPEREAHVESHNELLRQASKLLESHAAGELRVTIDRARSLRKWLVDHIQDKDRALGEFLAGLGSGQPT